MGSEKGYTLIELIIVMAIFVGVIMMTMATFENLLKKAGQQTRSAESQIEGIVGLELLRYDVEHSGYGLPWSFQNASTAANYSEVSPPSAVTGVDPTDFSDRPPRLPRALVTGTSSAASPILSGTSNTNPGSDYLVIKSALASGGAAPKRWSYINYSTRPPGTNESHIKQWSSDQYETSVKKDDRVITINSSYGASGSLNRQLIMNGGAFAFKAGLNGAIPEVSYKPTDPTQMYTVYTISENHDPSMPYNRADYFIRRNLSDKVPSSCNRGTGIFYKATATHGGGGSFYPLLDCVGDMQVVFHLDMDGNGSPGTYASADGSMVSSMESGVDATAVQNTLADAGSLRARLKQVLIYLLLHEGTRDKNFRYPSDTIVTGDPLMPGLGRVWSATGTAPNNLAETFGPDWRNYRWKIYTLLIRPKNLQ